MSFEWRLTTLGDFVRLQRGHDLTASEQRPGTVPVMGSAGPNGTHSESIAKGPGVVIGRSGASAGKVHLCEVDFWPHNTCLYVTDFLGNSPRFAYYLLQTLNLAAFNSGSAQPSLNRNLIYSVPVTLPSIREQHLIAEMLRDLDDRIALLRETNATLEAIAQALFKSWFVDFDPVRAKMAGRAPEGMDEAAAALFPDTFDTSELGPVPRGWKVRRLDEVAERITKGTTPTTLKRPFVPEGINFVKAESMTDEGDFLPEKFAFIDPETHELLRRSQLAAGDVLISIAGTIGRSAVITEEFLPANTNQAVALIRAKQGLYPSGLVVRFLQRAESRQLMGERVVQAVQANLSLGTLSGLRVVVPPPDTVRALNDLGIGPIDEAKAVNGKTIRTLATLRDTLLPRLISGQLRLPEATAIADEALA